MLKIILLAVFIQASFSNVGACDLSSIESLVPASVRGKTIKIVTTNDSAPFISEAPNGVPYGLDVDLMNLVSLATKLKFTYEYGKFSDFIKDVQADPLTISISSEFVTKERTKYVDFAQYIRVGSGFLAKAPFTGKIKGLSDLCGLKVAVLDGSVQQYAVQAQSVKCGSKRITILAGKNNGEVINDVLSGKAYVAVDDSVLLEYAAQVSHGSLTTVGTVFDVSPVGILCNKKVSGLCNAFVSTINLLINNGIYGNLLDQYGLSFADNGVCPSRINLNGGTGLSSCVPSTSFCKKASG